MADLMICPECGKANKISAVPCPKCEHVPTEEEQTAGAAKFKSQAKKGLWIFAAIALVFIFALFIDDDEAQQREAASPSASTAAVAQIKHFDFGIDTFVSRFNNFAGEAGVRKLQGPFNRVSGEVKDTMQILYSDAAGMVLTFEKGSGNLSEVTMVAGKASGANAADPLICMGAIIAIACPTLDANGRGQVLRDMGIITDNGANLPDKASTMRGNIKIWAMTSEQLGFWFGATPQ